MKSANVVEQIDAIYSEGEKLKKLFQVGIDEIEFRIRTRQPKTYDGWYAILNELRDWWRAIKIKGGYGWLREDGIDKLWDKIAEKTCCPQVMVSNLNVFRSRGRKR